MIAQRDDVLARMQLVRVLTGHRRALGQAVRSDAQIMALGEFVDLARRAQCGLHAVGHGLAEHLAAEQDVVGGLQLVGQLSEFLCGLLAQLPTSSVQLSASGLVPLSRMSWVARRACLAGVAHSSAALCHFSGRALITA